MRCIIIFCVLINIVIAQQYCPPCRCPPQRCPPTYCPPTPPPSCPPTSCSIWKSLSYSENKSSPTRENSSLFKSWSLWTPILSLIFTIYILNA